MCRRHLRVRGVTSPWERRRVPSCTMPPYYLFELFSRKGPAGTVRRRRQAAALHGASRIFMVSSYRRLGGGPLPRETRAGRLRDNAATLRHPPFFQIRLSQAWWKELQWSTLEKLPVSRFRSIVRSRKHGASVLTSAPPGSGGERRRAAR